MGKELADTYVEARAVFEEVDEALGQKLSDIMWNGPEETLTLTANAQPALMAVSMAVMRVLEARGLKLSDSVSYVAGHSLGEYSALCAAGTFSIADTARLLRIRGNAMQAAVPVGEGAMAAIIGLEHDAVSAICGRPPFLASARSPMTMAAASWSFPDPRLRLKRLRPSLPKKGAKRAIMLPVSAPFHSALMAPAAEAMREALATVEKKNPVVPVIANVRAAPVSDANEIAALLVEQVTGQVRWRETVEWFAANNVTQLYEIGSGKVLTGLARRIDKTVNGVAVNGAADIDQLLATHRLRTGLRP